MCFQQEQYNKAPETRVVAHDDAGGGERPDQWSSATALGQQGWARARGEGAVAGEGRSEFEWRSEGTRREATEKHALLRELETRRFRVETASAKRKASQYQTGMREAHVSGGKPLYAHCRM